MHLVHTGHAPTYLEDSVTATRDLGLRSRLRSANSRRYELPQTQPIIDERGLLVSGMLAHLLGTLCQQPFMNFRTLVLLNVILKQF